MSYAYGEQNPNQGETAVSWQTWSDGNGNIPTIDGNADWGKLNLDLAGEEGRSAVYDLGSSHARTFTLTENRYGTGGESAVLQIRGDDTTIFLQDAHSPMWENYTTPVSKTWRYIQVRETTSTIYYVDAGAGGDDGHTGLSIAEAWKTIQHAVDSVSAGALVYILDGTYNEAVDLTGTTGTEGESGIPHHHISYIGQSRDGVIIEGSDSLGYGFKSGQPAAGQKCMNCISICNLTVQQFVSTGVLFFKDKADGVYSASSSHDITIDNVCSHDNGGGGIVILGGEVDGGSYNIRILNCETYNNVSAHHGIKLSGDAREITTGEHIYDSIIDHCISHNNTQMGIHCSSGNYNVRITNNISYGNGIDGIEGYQNWDCTYDHNISYSNGQDGFNLGKCVNDTISNNLIYTNTRNGIVLNNVGGTTDTVHTVINNVIYGNVRGIEVSTNGGDLFYHNTITNNTYGMYVQTCVGSNNLWYDNIISHNATQEYFPAPNLNTCDYNCWHPAAQVDGHKGVHCFVGDPLFTTEFTNLHIGVGSSCIGTGNNVGVTLDLDGVTRGDPPDVGAYEYV